jgi:hypothetical protein
MINLQSCYIHISHSKPIPKRQDYNGVNMFAICWDIINKTLEKLGLKTNGKEYSHILDGICVL